ncbi:MAG TPA: hypothetical protein VHD83_14610 [Puia sp.]|nr:hypothetical protein [Puia sp.]
MSIFNGLYGYEVIMLVLGVMLFLVLIFILLRSVVKDQPWGKLVPFFLLPIFMIGFPSFKKLSYDDGKIELEKATHSLSDDPTDTTIRKQAEAAIRSVEGRGQQDPGALVALAGAHWALGNYDSCQQLVMKAEGLSPADTALRRQIGTLQAKVQLHNQFKRDVDVLDGYLKRIQSGDKDTALARSMAAILDTLKKPVYVSDKDALVISKAYVALDHPDKALQVTDKIVESGAASDSVVHFREALKRGDGGLEALKLPATPAARAVKTVTFDKNVITRKGMEVVKKS